MLRARRFLRVFGICLLCAACVPNGGCTSRQMPPDHGTAARPPVIQASRGQSVHVSVRGGEPALNEDLASMITAYLQSERDLVPAEDARRADVLVRVRIEDVQPTGRRDIPVRGGQMLGTTAAGATLGALLGGAVGGYSGVGWGAGGGALLGVGVALLDSPGQNMVWSMKARVGMGRSGREPAEADMVPVTVSAGAAGGRQEALPALEDRLSRVILEAVQP